jgi:hypothetical protein
MCICTRRTSARELLALPNSNTSPTTANKVFLRIIALLKLKPTDDARTRRALLNKGTGGAFYDSKRGLTFK